MASPKRSEAVLRPASTLLRLVPPGNAAEPGQTRPGSPDEVVSPPDFDEKHAIRWHEVVGVLQGEGSWRAGLGDLVRLYCIAWCEAVEARQHVVAGGLMVHPDITSGVPDPAVAKVVNPWRCIAREAEATAARLAQVLGLVPAPRRRS